MREFTRPRGAPRLSRIPAAPIVALACALNLTACAHAPPTASAPTPSGAGGAPGLNFSRLGTGSIATALATDSKSRLLASVSFDGIRLWDLGSGRILRAFPPLHPGRIDGGNVEFTADDATLINASERGGARAFDVRTGAEVAPPARPRARGTAPQCRRAGRDCVMLYGPGKRSEVIATQSSAEVKRWWADLNRTSPPPTRVELRTLPDGRLVGAWTASASYVCEDGKRNFLCDLNVHYSRDGRRVALMLSSRALVLTDVRAGAKALTVTLPARDADGKPGVAGKKDDIESGEITAVAITPDGRLLAAGDDSGDIVLFDMRSGASRQLWDVRDNPGRSGVAASPNGQWLVTGVGRHSELWDVTTGQPALDLRGSCAVAFSRDSRRLVCIEPHALTVWDVGSGAPLAQWTLPPRFDHGYALTVENKQAFFSPDGSKLLATFDEQHSRGAWAYRYAFSLDIATRRSVRVGGTLDASVAGSLDAGGRYVSFMQLGGTIERYDFATGAVKQTGRIPAAVAGPSGGLPGFLDGGLAPGGRYAVMLPEEAVNDVNAGYTVFDTVAGKELAVPHHVAAAILGFAPDGKSALFADEDDAATLVELATGRATHRYAGHTDKVYDAAFSGDGGTLVTAASDNTVRIWDVRRDRQIGQIYPGAGGPDDWLIAAPNGSFDGSPGGWESILWRFGGPTFDVAEPETFFNDFFSPGLLADLVSRREPSAATLATIDRRSPRVSLGVLARPPYGRTIRVRVAVAEAPPDAVHDRGSGARDVRLLRNGSLVHLWPGDALRGSRTAVLEAAVTVTAGANQLQAYAFNSDGVRSAPAETQLVGPRALARRGTAYVLAIGVNAYANPDFSLRYAASDAAAFGRELGEQEARLYGQGAVDVVTLTDRHATKDRIRAALGALARRVGPEDVVYVYFAGHGVANGDRYYLVPYDLGYSGPQASIDGAGFDTILRHSLSDLDLAGDLLPIDARRIVLVIDACESGQALGDVKKVGPMNNKGLAQLAYEKGMYVLAASQGDQAALESSRYRHGLLTYALIEEALRERQAVAPRSPDYLVLRQWLAFAQLRVPQLQLAMMQSAQRAGRQIAVVPGEERTIAQAQDRTLQRPRVFDPPYADSDGFVVAVFPPRAVPGR